MQGSELWGRLMSFEVTWQRFTQKILFLRKINQLNEIIEEGDFVLCIVLRLASEKLFSEVVSAILEALT